HPSRVQGRERLAFRYRRWQCHKMTRKRLIDMVGRCFLAFTATSLLAFSQTPEALFQSRCATCHSMGNAVGAPLPTTLRQMSWQAILTALETGKMKGIGDAVLAIEREAIAKFIGSGGAPQLAPAAKCTGTPSRIAAAWNGWADAANTR